MENLQEVFLDEGAYRQYMKNLKAECEIDSNEIYDEIIDGEIDLLELVREYIILDLPPYPQCNPKCEDDSEIEKYSDDGIDSRWQIIIIKIKLFLNMSVVGGKLRWQYLRKRHLRLKRT